MKSPFFNPWDERVARDIEIADKRRKDEIEGLRQVTVQEDGSAVVVQAPKAARDENTKGLACPVCKGVPKTVRSDGVTIARHLPMSTGAKLYRDTEFCNGQGRPGIAP